MAVPQPAPAEASLVARVRADLVRTAYVDSLYGASFGLLIVALFAYAIRADFPLSAVTGWLLVAVAVNAMRLVTRWIYLRRPVPMAQVPHWSRLFTAVSAATGLSWGLGAWLFYTPYDSVYRVIVVLVLAGMTSGASRLLAPILPANLLYLLFAIGPLQARLMLNPDTRSFVVAMMSVVYLGYMAVAARQQARTLERTTRLGHEHAATVDSLGAEIKRREIMEQELRSATARAVAASRTKDEFVATMSHEIRTPMNGLIGMLRIVRDSPLTPTQREHVETAAASADTLLDLLNNVLDFSKIEAGRLDLERIVFSPNAVVKGVAAMLESRARAKQLEFSVHVDPAVPVALVGDPTRLRQVLFNLVGNAIKFTERGRVELEVSCETRDASMARVRFAVTDTGIGIAADALPRLFAPFMQADSSMSRRFGGTGLGLAISQKIVEAMEGKITVSSEPGRGAAFHFTLPFAVVPSEIVDRGATENRYRPPALQGRVLVVEDDRVNQRVLSHFLKQMGLEIGLAEDGHAAVEFAAAGSWDAILMDCQLPGLDGLEATRRIRVQRAGRPLPIIALTANASARDRADCLAAGMDDFLTKPLRVELLAAALQKWLPARNPT